MLLFHKNCPNVHFLPKLKNHITNNQHLIKIRINLQMLTFYKHTPAAVLLPDEFVSQFQGDETMKQ